MSQNCQCFLQHFKPIRSERRKLSSNSIPLVLGAYVDRSQVHGPVMWYTHILRLLGDLQELEEGPIYRYISRARILQKREDRMPQVCDSQIETMLHLVQRSFWHLCPHADWPLVYHIPVDLPWISGRCRDWRASTCSRNRTTRLRNKGRQGVSILLVRPSTTDTTAGFSSGHVCVADLIMPVSFAVHSIAVNQPVSGD